MTWYIMATPTSCARHGPWVTTSSWVYTLTVSRAARPTLLPHGRDRRHRSPWWVGPGPAVLPRSAAPQARPNPGPGQAIQSFPVLHPVVSLGGRGGPVISPGMPPTSYRLPGSQGLRGQSTQPSKGNPGPYLEVWLAGGEGRASAAPVPAPRGQSRAAPCGPASWAEGPMRDSLPP